MKRRNGCAALPPLLLLLALFFARLGDHAAEREAQRRKYIDRRHARTEEPEYRQNRRDA